MTQQSIPHQSPVNNYAPATYDIAYFHSATDKAVKSRSFTFDALVTELRQSAATTPHPGMVALGPRWCDEGHKAAWKEVKGKSLCAFAPAKFRVPYCEDKNVESVCMLWIDLDDTPTALVTPLYKRLAELRLSSVLYETPTKPKPGCVRMRLGIPLSQPVPGSEWKSFWPRAVAHIGAAELPGLDDACSNPSRIFFLPVQRDDGTPAGISAFVSVPLDPSTVPAAPSRTRKEKPAPV